APRVGRHGRGGSHRNARGTPAGVAGTIQPVADPTGGAAAQAMAGPQASPTAAGGAMAAAGAALAGAASAAAGVASAQAAAADSAADTVLSVAFAYPGPVPRNGQEVGALMKAHERGRQEMEAALGGKVRSTVVQGLGPEADVEGMLRQLATQGHQIIFTTLPGHLDV